MSAINSETYSIHTSPNGGLYQDILGGNEDHYTTSINVSKYPDMDAYEIDHEQHQYGNLDDQGNERGDFEALRYFMSLEQLTAYRDMLTEIIDNASK